MKEHTSDSSAKSDPLPKKPRDKHPGRAPLPAFLPREEIVHDIKPQDKTCGTCGHFLTLIGSEDREQLEILPIRFVVKKHRRLKYGCRCCFETICIAPSPNQAVEKCLAGASLMAHVATDKYGYHLPLYRQAQRFANQGVPLSRATLWNWLRLSSQSLEPLVLAMKKDLLAMGHLFADETPVPVLDKRGKKGYMWSYSGAVKEGDKLYSLSLYDFTDTREGRHASAFLEDFEGECQVDAYSGYDRLTALDKVQLILCMAHLRRKFVEALIVNPQSKGAEMLEKISLLYDLERSFKQEKLSLEKIKEARQQQAVPILEEMHAWLLKHKHLVPPKSRLGMAIYYGLANWDGLKSYVLDGHLEIDNNRAERSLRGVVLGRKNYLFIGNATGGRAAAIFYSLIETCKQNNVDPVAYLSDILEKIPTHPNKRISELLPYHWKLPETLSIHQPPPQKVA